MPRAPNAVRRWRRVAVEAVASLAPRGSEAAHALAGGLGVGHRTTAAHSFLASARSESTEIIATPHPNAELERTRRCASRSRERCRVSEREPPRSICGPSQRCWPRGAQRAPETSIFDDRETGPVGSTLLILPSQQSIERAALIVNLETMRFRVDNATPRSRMSRMPHTTKRIELLTAPELDAALALPAFASLVLGAFAPDPIVKRCSCSAAYSHPNWDKLPLIGSQRLGPAEWYELRSCIACGSTIAIPEESPEAFAEVVRSAGDADEEDWQTVRRVRAAATGQECAL